MISLTGITTHQHSNDKPSREYGYATPLELDSLEDLANILKEGKRFGAFMPLLINSDEPVMVDKYWSSQPTIYPTPLGELDHLARQAKNFAKGSKVWAIDIETADRLIYLPYSDKKEKYKNHGLLPLLTTEKKVRTMLRKHLGIHSNTGQVNYRHILTNSWSTSLKIVNGEEMDQVKMHCWLEFDEPLSHKEFVEGLRIRIQYEQFYVGLTKGKSKPKPMHPYVDMATNSAKAYFEHPNGFVSYNHGVVIKKAYWLLDR